MTTEPPKGIKANLINNFRSVNQEEYESNLNYRNMLFPLMLFHSLTLERKKFGAIGWTLEYDFMDSDFVSSNIQLYVRF